MTLRHRDSRLVTLAVLVLVLSAFAPATTSAGASTTPTSLYNCNQLAVRPKTLVLTCADSNRYMRNIIWSTWTPSSARATGTLTWNDCTPSCVSGHWHTQHISFLARYPKTLKGRRLFTQLFGPAGSWGGTTRVWTLPTSPE